MGIIDMMKKSAESNNTTIQSSKERELEQIFNKMFYLEKNIEEETKFVKQVMTRGLESQERVGLHASALIAPPSKYCIRQQVLSLLYRQDQGEQVPIGLMRIFEEGNAIHEKWQRLFIRAGYATAKDCDFTRYNKEYQISYTPDVIVDVPGFGQMVVEIKSMNTFSFKKLSEKGHPTGKKQCFFYMHLTGIHKGIVLCEDKNTQDFRVFYYDYDAEVTIEPRERAEMIQYYKQLVIDEHRMVKRVNGCNSPYCKRAEECPLRDACYNVGKGRRKIE